MLVTITLSRMWKAICEGLIDFPPSFHIYFPSPCFQKHALNQRPWQHLMLAKSCFYYFFPGNNSLSTLSSDWGHRNNHLFPSARILSCSSTPFQDRLTSAACIVLHLPVLPLAGFLLWGWHFHFTLVHLISILRLCINHLASSRWSLG